MFCLSLLIESHLIAYSDTTTNTIHQRSSAFSAILQNYSVYEYAEKESPEADSSFVVNVSTYATRGSRYSLSAHDLHAVVDDVAYVVNGHWALWSW